MTMNPLPVARALLENYFFIRGLTRTFGPPDDLSDAECEKVFDDLRSDRFMMHRFAFVLNVKTSRLSRFINVDKFLCPNKTISLEEFFFRVHPDYMADYLRWGRAIYSYAQDLKYMLKPLVQTYRITLPIRVKDGKYYWVLQESMALQLDKERNMISHINIYSIARPFDPKEKIPLIGDVWDENFEHENWADTLRKLYFTKNPFILTPEQSRIVAALSENIGRSNSEIAEELGKTKNTVDALNKQILARARDSFPHQSFENTRDVVVFLKNMNFLQTQFRLPDGLENGNK